MIENYLKTFAKGVNYTLIKAQGSGNICGIKNALKIIASKEQFMLIWCDLILSEQFNPQKLDKSKSYIGISEDFECSWSFKNGKLDKISSKEFGVAGCYIFNDKSKFDGIPETGSFASWLKNSAIPLTPISMQHSKETGTLEAIEKISPTENRCRPYNKMEFTHDKVIKTGLTDEGKKLIEREVVWYEKMSGYGFNKIPNIYSLNPLTMEKINGTNIFNAKLTPTQKKQTLDKLIDAVNLMHSYETKPADRNDLVQEYFTKTVQRLESIKHAIPFAQDKFITINGKICKNIIYDNNLLKDLVKKNLLNTTYCPIHGDCTLTNTMTDENGEIYFIDARGYFGSQKVLGDIRYDWAKLYYSIEGCFDEFNIKNFDLEISQNSVCYEIHSAGWKELTNYFISKLNNVNIDEIKQIHAIIWLSLASHTWEDFDSMCLAFYNGLYLINEYLEGENNAAERKTTASVTA